MAHGLGRRFFRRSLNFRPAERLIATMRRPLSTLVSLLLAWCIGFQPVAQAMGVRCLHGSGSPSAVVAEADDAHSMHVTHAVQDMVGHEGHALHMADAMSSDEAPDRDSKGCDCGCTCAMPGCLGSVPAVCPTSTHPLVSVSTAVHPSAEFLSRPRAAHGLDLIRPPSKS